MSTKSVATSESVVLPESKKKAKKIVIAHTLEELRNYSMTNNIESDKNAVLYLFALDVVDSLIASNKFAGKNVADFGIVDRVVAFVEQWKKV